MLSRLMIILTLSIGCCILTSCGDRVTKDVLIANFGKEAFDIHYKGTDSLVATVAPEELVLVRSGTGTRGMEYVVTYKQSRRRFEVALSTNDVTSQGESDVYYLALANDAKRVPFRTTTVKMLGTQKGN